MNWSKAAVVSSPRASASSIAFRSPSMARTRSMSCGREQVAYLLGGRLGLERAPAVVGELAHGAGGVGGELVQLGLGEAGLVARVGGQRRPLRLQGLVEQLPDALQGAVEVALAGQVAA